MYRISEQKVKTQVSFSAKATMQTQTYPFSTFSPNGGGRKEIRIFILILKNEYYV
jgi:hypothetical protein